MIKDLLKYGVISSLTALFCCVTPSIFFLVGIGSATFAFSFADSFYNVDTDGSPNIFSWIIRLIGLFIVYYGIYRFNKKESCSLNAPEQKKKNKLIFGITLVLVSFSLYAIWYFGTTWIFDNFITPAREIELKNLS
tara:strand:- start:7 stop:414 length:408 start_codon:yes stop_codon:yes gene_type:complete